MKVETWSHFLVCQLHAVGPISYKSWKKRDFPKGPSQMQNVIQKIEKKNSGLHANVSTRSVSRYFPEVLPA